MKKWICCLLITIALASCQNNAEPPQESTLIPFPTVTPGQEIIGILSTQDRSSNSFVVNPATLAAQARQATPTPDISECPATSSSAELPSQVPDNNRNLIDTIIGFLSDGGSPASLRIRLTRWDLLGDDGFLWSDVDLTGEGTPEIIISYTSPANEGALLILGCQQGQYSQWFFTTSDEPTPPEMITFGDMNQNRLTDLVFMTRVCDEALGGCSNNTQVIGWEPSQSRILSLLSAQVISQEVPEIVDMDDDAVNEIVLRFRDDGNLTTGPLRTGLAVYDWNGTVYVLSIWQPDEVAYRIQIIHEADRYFDQQNYAQAAVLYNQAASDEELDDWLDDEEPFLAGYALYRYLVAGAVLGQPIEQLGPIHQQLNGLLQPNVYTQLGNIFWDTFTPENDITAACNQVNSLAETLPEAVDLLNRYGNRSPTYTLSDFCPF